MLNGGESSEPLFMDHKFPGSGKKWSSIWFEGWRYKEVDLVTVISSTIAHFSWNILRPPLEFLAGCLFTLHKELKFCQGWGRSGCQHQVECRNMSCPCLTPALQIVTAVSCFTMVCGVLMSLSVLNAVRRWRKLWVFVHIIMLIALNTLIVYVLSYTNTAAFTILLHFE